MLNVALAQLKAHKRRFIAVTLAVLLGVGFLAATLMVRTSTQTTLEASIGAGYPQGAVVIAADPRIGSALTQDMLSQVESAPGVGSATAQVSSIQLLSSSQQEFMASVRSVADEPDLRTVTMVSGELPSSDSEIAVDQRSAERYGIKAGDVITVPTLSPGPDRPAPSSPEVVPYTVTGIAENTTHPQFGAFAMTHLSESGIQRFAGDAAPIDTILVEPATGVAPEQLADELGAVVGADFTSRTSQAQTVADVAFFSGGVDQLTPILLLFASLALVVTMLVISNTFSVLVAQRTRELALLRTLGAQGSQVQRSVLVEALVVGLVASILGVLLAIGCLALLIAWARSNPDFSFATLRLDAWALTVPIIVGVILTVLAALIPARRATRIAPLAALRPAEEATLKTQTGRTRLRIGVFATLIGFALLALGWFLGMLVIAFFGGLISFIGILMAAQLFMPGAIAGVGAAFNRTGVPARLAALNSVRNPGRTTATATALLIGATLVSMMIVGAQTAKSTMESSLNDKFPVDLSVNVPLENGSGVNAGMPGLRTLEQAQRDAERLQGMDGIERAAVLQPAGDVMLVGSPNSIGPLYVLDEGSADVLNDPSIDMSQSVIWSAEDLDITELEVTGADNRAIPVRETKSNIFDFVMGTQAAASLGISPDNVAASEDVGNATMIWIKVSPGQSPNEILDLSQTIADTLNISAAAITGAAVERAMFMQIIDVLLLIVLALLAVAVVISIIGVANTLSLSVLERTQENALLRALGLTRGQLRTMLAMEALLISVVSAALGMILGGVYGAVGAGTALILLGQPVITVPWGQFGIILLVAVLAGLLASLMPARRAARLSPVQGLATE